MTYPQQGQSVLNAYWDEIEGEAELIWDFSNQFVVLDIDKGKEGSDLDEFNAHRFLERLGETKTVKQMRDELKEIDMDFNKRMALVEYLLWRYKKTVSDFVSKPQGGIDPEELAEAQRLIDEVQHALQLAQAAQEEARQREEEAKAAAEEARQREAEARAAAEDAREKEEIAIEKEKPFKIAQEELERALAELHKQEEEYARRCSELEKRSQDSNLGVVQRNKAANELAQLKSQDPLPLRQAKITTEAAERKADKARAPFKEARENAEVARAEAERTHNEAEKAKREAERTEKQAIQARAESDAAVEEVYRALEEAEEKMREVMSRPSVPHGQVWWMERELTETKKYLPKRKQQ